MIFFVLGVWIFLRTLCVDAANVSFENIALRQQLAVLQRSVPRPKVYRRGRLFLGCLSPPLSGWRARFLIFQPPPFFPRARQGLQPYLPREIRNPPPARPPIHLEIRD